MGIRLQPLPPQEAIDYLAAKGYTVGFAWQDVYAEEHAAAFTVAKMLRIDLLQTVHRHLLAALEEGKTLAEFTAGLRPILEQEGWWGKQEMVDPATGDAQIVQLGSPRRLEVIYDVNIRSANSAGRWERAVRSQRFLPLMRYSSMHDARVRPQHLAWDKTALPVDHPWWNTHYPPNGWRCRCLAYPISQAAADADPTLKRSPPPGGTITWTNPRTGEVREVPVGIDPGFDYNPGKERQRRLYAALAEKERLYKGVKP